MLRKSLWAVGIAALTTAMVAFTASPAMAQRRGGGARGGSFRGGAAHVSAVHAGGVYRGSAYRGGVYRGGAYRGGAYRGYEGYRGYGGYYGGYGWPGVGIGLGYGYPYYGGYYDSPYYGSAYYSDYAYPSVSNFYDTTPSTALYYTPSQSIAPSAYVPSADTMKATIVVHVPLDAKVWFDGAPTQQTGEWRQFASPPLDSGRTFHYDIRAQWIDNGKMVDQTRRIDVSAGSLNNVDFLRPAPAVNP